MKIPFSKHIAWDRSREAEGTVRNVDLNRYAGKWYEIAAFPAWFEKGCRCSTAEFVHMDDYVEVRASCERDGKLAVSTARAFPMPGTGDSQLKVRFIWPFESDYWIIALDENYQYVMVGHPEKKYLWIMSRAPQLDEELYQSLVSRALAKGYDVTRLKRADQSCGVRRRTSQDALAV
jgi:apolipoprotein D and lipocalin family protein